MEVATRNGPAVEVLQAILPSLDDRNAEVAAKVRVIVGAVVVVKILF